MRSRAALLKPLTARLLWELRGLSTTSPDIARLGHWHDPGRRKIILCTRKGAKRARGEVKFKD